MEGIHATTGDNIVLKTNACVIWKIVDIEAAARNAAETMRPDGKAIMGDDITKMRNDVLKQATASLSAFIGGVRFSDTAHATSVAASEGPRGHGSHSASGAPLGGSGLLFDVDRLTGCVQHANRVCNQFGVEVMAINIISAFPTDAKLCEAMAKGAVAAAEAEQAEVQAQGNAKALVCTASAEADALRLRANAEADAERIRAQGLIDGAMKLDQSHTAVMLAKIERTGGAIGDKAAFFFGQTFTTCRTSSRTRPSSISTRTRRGPGVCRGCRASSVAKREACVRERAFSLRRSLWRAARSDAQGERRSAEVFPHGAPSGGALPFPFSGP